MNQEQHKAEAERLLGEASSLIEGGYPRTDGHPLAGPEFWAALTHAVLATIPDPVEAEPRSFQLPDGWCACLRLAYQHRVTPLCDTTPMPPPAPRHMDPFEPACICGANGNKVHDRRTTPGCKTAVVEGPGQTS